jgi:hypothetical protein
VLAVEVDGAVVAVVARVVISFVAFSNSRLASPMDLAISGSFWGPQMNKITRMATTVIASKPTMAIVIHITGHFVPDIRVLNLRRERIRFQLAHRSEDRMIALVTE